MQCGLPGPNGAFVTLGEFRAAVVAAAQVERKLWYHEMSWFTSWVRAVYGSAASADEQPLLEAPVRLLPSVADARHADASVLGPAPSHSLAPRAREPLGARRAGGARRVGAVHVDALAADGVAACPRDGRPPAREPAALLGGVLKLQEQAMLRLGGALRRPELQGA